MCSRGDGGGGVGGREGWIYGNTTENERMENWTIKRTHKQRADNFRGLYRRLIDFIPLILSWSSIDTHTHTHTHILGMTAGYIMNTVIEGNISDGSSMLILNNHSLISLSLSLTQSHTHFLWLSDLLTEWKSRLLKEQIRGLEKEHFPCGREDFNYNGEPCLAKKRNK